MAKPGPADDLLSEDAPPKVPWHFWMLLGALAIYLGWRLLQGGGWVLDHL